MPGGHGLRAMWRPGGALEGGWPAGPWPGSAGFPVAPCAERTRRRAGQAIVCREPGACLAGEPHEGAGAAKQRGPHIWECLRAGPCGGLCGKAGRQEDGPGLSARLRCLPWPAAAPPEPPMSSEPWGWGSLPTPLRPRVMPPSTPLARPPAPHPGGISRRVSGRLVLRWL